mmetsp:Transcript_60874/g.166860  ORF Transcript_60874/g.166860 Transcript_60874/m.166860 type:complete len:261 (+) Transcript_60874:1647-2429(+)
MSSSRLPTTTSRPSSSRTRWRWRWTSMSRRCATTSRPSTCSPSTLTPRVPRPTLSPSSRSAATRWRSSMPRRSEPSRSNPSSPPPSRTEATPAVLRPPRSRGAFRRRQFALSLPAARQPVLRARATGRPDRHVVVGCRTCARARGRRGRPPTEGADEALGYGEPTRTQGWAGVTARGLTLLYSVSGQGGVVAGAQQPGSGTPERWASAPPTGWAALGARAMEPLWRQVCGAKCMAPNVADGTATRQAAPTHGTRRRETLW